MDDATDGWLEEMGVELPAREAGPKVQEPALRLKKIHYNHEAMINAIIQDPTLTQNDLAAIFDRTPAWISIMMQTDVFKARLAERRDEIIDPVLRATVNECFAALAKRSVEVLLEKLAAPNISDNLALRAAELGAKVFGPANTPPPPPAIPSDHLAVLAERMVSLGRRVGQGPVEDAKVIEW